MFRDYIKQLPTMMACQIKDLNNHYHDIYVEELVISWKLNYIVHLPNNLILHATSAEDYLVFDSGDFKIVNKDIFNTLYELSIEEQVRDIIDANNR